MLAIVFCSPMLEKNSAVIPNVSPKPIISLSAFARVQRVQSRFLVIHVLNHDVSNRWRVISANPIYVLGFPSLL
jgi:hypothetical protein